MAAATERNAFYEKQADIPMSDEEDRLRIRDEEAEKAWRNALAGEPGVIAELLERE